ncbi:IS66 family transposase [Bradyrhizobium sp. CCGB01]|nr:IS66 family transposase [Bradyrhizobium sp. CCGB20]MCP3397201.1 IS66 family transposase [Bradyrhizobium sp. CCGB20]MCP3405706.1 IS66 family transposase [Bradyrhizobium sp. CCGB01]
MNPWFEKQLSMISSGSTLADDIRYALNHWQGLTRFLDDGRLELDTNPVENAIRPICLTRKTYSLLVMRSGPKTGPCSHPSRQPVSSTTSTRSPTSPYAHGDHRQPPQSKIDDSMPWRSRKTSSQHQ